MKNLRGIIGFIVLLSITIGCTNTEKTHTSSILTPRIKKKASNVIDGYRYTILEIDGREYLTQSGGGFVMLSDKAQE